MKRLEYGVLETILLYRLRRLGLVHLGCIGRWLLCSGGCLLRFHCITKDCGSEIYCACSSIIHKGTQNLE